MFVEEGERLFPVPLGGPCGTEAFLHGGQGLGLAKFAHDLGQRLKQAVGDQQDVLIGLQDPRGREVPLAGLTVPLLKQGEQTANEP